MYTSLSYGKFDETDFESIYGYLIHVINSKHNLSKMIVSPNFYKTILKTPFWYEVRFAKNAKTGFTFFGVDKMPNGCDEIELVVTSIINGSWCVI